MAHEITQADSLLLNGNEKAWHGLGTVIDEQIGAVAGAERVGMLWHVDQLIPKVMLPSGREMEIGELRINVRADTETYLGEVSDSWQIVQNRTLAEFVDELSAEDDKICIESCGSIRGGAKVWFLVRGESFSLRKQDEVKPYICVSNGFDGKTGIRCTPTSVRVVCSNTLHMVIPRYDHETGKMKRIENAFACSHTGDIRKRINEAREALGLYQKATANLADMATEMTNKEVTAAQISQFFLDMYSRQFHQVNVPDAEPKKRDEALNQFAKFARRFDREANAFGATKWVMANSYTGWLQHDRHAISRFKSTDAQINRRLFGTDIERSDEAMAYAVDFE